jgi:hypothetical protein
VIHHLSDRRAAARELARVLRPGGVVLVRTTFREGLEALVYDYWPSLRALDADRFPAQHDVVADFATAGLVLRDITSSTQPLTGSLRAFHSRMLDRPQSKFAQLTAAQFQAGLRRLAAAAEREAPDRPVPVFERYDVAVFSRP